MFVLTAREFYLKSTFQFLSVFVYFKECVLFFLSERGSRENSKKNFKTQIICTFLVVMFIKEKIALVNDVNYVETRWI